MMPRATRAAAVKTVLFTVVVPGTTTVLLPWLVVEATGSAAPGRWPFAGPFGLVAIAAGVLLYAWCATSFVRIGRGTPAPIDPPRRLVTSGPYRLTRNPMYVAVVSVAAGEGLFFGSWPLLCYALILLAVFDAFVRLHEEPTLARQFGTAYEQYCHRVPRWLGCARRGGNDRAERGCIEPPKGA
ncbi:MAG: isoprenylcysteine carboxylmethyltransferase family protein [Candidatus Dadabacteria bacterium]|nr:MAG: isoprenylcysteine carboxylmethyltransferase family protein [Candidatus Dadabacteria bacterium]